MMVLVSIVSADGGEGWYCSDQAGMKEKEGMNGGGPNPSHDDYS